MSEHQYKGRSSGRRPYSRPNRRHSQSSSQSGGNRNRRYNQSGQKRQDNKKPVSFWTKLLAFFGIGKSTSPRPQKKAASGSKPVKSNTRVVRSQEGRPRKAPKLPVSVPRLYVGNLSYEATESDIEDLFKGVGSVNSVEIIYNPRTHKSKGYGFVEMRTMEDAYRAVEVLHDQPFMGRDLTVSAANERDIEGDREERESTASSGSGRRETEVDEVQETVTPLIDNSDTPSSSDNPVGENDSEDKTNQ